MKRLVAGGAVGALAATLLSAGGVGSAVAATGDGTISVTVVQDTNVNKERDTLDVPIEGVDVRIHDVAGDVLTVQTDADGVATLSAADNTLAGGRYRIEVVNPNAGTYSEAQIADAHAEPEFAPAVSFVDVRDGADATLSVGYVDYSTLGVDGARIYSAVQPDDVWLPNNGSPEVYSVNYDLSGGVTPVTTRSELGAVYGFGIDDQNLDLYVGAYAKRGSLYGPGGAGAIYRVNSVTGDWEVYATVANAGDTAHDIGPVVPGSGLIHQDYAFREAVGRESLGDVEVSDDNRFVTTVNLNTQELVVFPLQEAAGAQPIQTLSVPAPADCASDWQPMGLGERGTSLYVGAVCGSDLRAFVLEYERAADGTLSATPVSTLEGDVSATVPRAGQPGPGFGVLGDCRPVDWRVWTDTVPQNCVDDGMNIPLKQIGAQFVVPQPMLGDIDFVDDGKMILSFRDRGGDQYGHGLYLGNKTNGGPSYGQVIATGDIIAIPADATSLDFANPAHDFEDAVAAGHNQVAFSGITTVPGSGTIVGNAMDPNHVLNSNGVREWDAETGDYMSGQIVTGEFGKAMGLADLEALVLEQSQQIGNRIWSDIDQDGVQGPTEPGIAGIQVSLYDAEGNVVATTETDANGEYWFDTADGLEPETEYEVRLDRPSDFEEGGPLAGYDPTEFRQGSNRGIDSNGELTDEGVVFASVTTPDAGINDHSIDFGFVPTLVSVGDYVWFDENNDGLQNEGETPLAGVEVILYGPDGGEVARTTTDANGYYAFTDLVASTEYSIQFPTTVTVDGEDVLLTRPNAGDDDLADSDANPETGRVTFTTPADGENSAEPNEADDPSIDAGYAAPVLVSVGDFVWVDADRDGLQDENEAPVAGAEVILYDADGAEVARTTTDADGYYAFTDLVASRDYSIQFPTTVTVDGEVLPLTQQGAGSDRGNDSNPGADGRHSFTAPASGDNSGEPNEADDPTIDAGYAAPVLVSVGDFLWIDADRDGLQDENEAPVAGAEVILYDADGTEVARTTTDADGYYAFTDLASSTDYTIAFPTSVTVDGVVHPLTQQGAGSDPGNDSNPGADGRHSFTSPASGDNSGEPNEADNPTIDAGYAPPAPVVVSVGDFVWIDTDGDGVQDAGEPGIPDVVLTLTGPDGEPVTDVFGNPVPATKTDSDGKYSFDDLPALEPGQSYTVTVTPPAGYKPTTPGVGAGETDSSTGSASSGDLTVDGARDATLDFGFVPDLVSIGDYVWLDDNRDGIQGAEERPVPGVTVKLFDADGELVAETTTDENGYYAFTDLLPGTDYYLEFPTSVELDGKWFTLTKPGQGDDRGADSNADPANGRVPVTTPAEGSNSGEPGEADDPTYDVGYVLSPVVPTPSPTPGPGGLPATGGANLLPLGGLALALMIGGAVIFIARRRAAQQ